MNNGKGYLSAFTNSLSANNILVVGDNIGDATSVGKNWAVAQIMVTPIDGTKNL